MATRRPRSGYINFIFGCMFASKSAKGCALVDKLHHRRSRGKRRRIWYAKDIDLINDSGPYITSRNGIKIKCDATPSSFEEWEAFIMMIGQAQGILLIDECQFLPITLLPVLHAAVAAGADIVLVGLDSDYKRDVFDFSGALLLDPRVLKYHVTAYCDVCGRRATLSQRLDKYGKPVVQRTEPVRALKATEGSAENLTYSYVPRCKTHHVVDH